MRVLGFYGIREVIMEKCRLVFSGSGGQGVITAAIILAEAAVLYENLIAVQSQVYGPAARGGATRSDVIISDSEIHYPKVIQPNVLVCLTQEAYSKFYPIIRPGGLLITDTRYVKIQRKVDAQQKELPIYLTVTDLVKAESIMKVLKDRIPSSFLEMNRKALDLGMKLAEDVTS
jgi:2-oxoglutarate ferredoxin oxidoreductase subunit gamma